LTTSSPTAHHLTTNAEGNRTRSHADGGTVVPYWWRTT
jgi:hypothetical protein